MLIPIANNTIKIAIVGGGWGGLTVAYKLLKCNTDKYNIDLFEAGQFLGGRARTVMYKDNHLDNGQHILVGAYKNTLQLLQELSPNKQLSDIFDIFNMQWHVRNNFSLKDIKLPYLEKILKNKVLNIKLGLSIILSNIPIKSKLELAFIMLKLKINNYTYNKNIESVKDWFIYMGISHFLQNHFFIPLCISALNTNIENACIYKFITALKLTIGSNCVQDAQFFIPKQGLSELLITPIVNYLQQLNKKQHNFNLYKNTLITDLLTNKNNEKLWQLMDKNHKVYANYDIVVLATPPHSTQKILNINDDEYDKHMQYMPITTIYVKTNAKIDKNIPFLIFNEDIIFQKENNIWAIVCSAKYLDSSDVLLKLSEYKKEFQHDFILIKSICEKRATYKCTKNSTSNILNIFKNIPYINNSLYICGDYLNSQYPATLEAAIDSAINVANNISAL